MAIAKPKIDYITKPRRGIQYGNAGFQPGDRVPRKGTRHRDIKLIRSFSWRVTMSADPVLQVLATLSFLNQK